MRLAATDWTVKQLGDDEFAVFNRGTSDFHLLNFLDFAILQVISDATEGQSRESVMDQVSISAELLRDEQFDRYVAQAIEQMCWVGLVRIQARS